MVRASESKGRDRQRKVITRLRRYTIVTSTNFDSWQNTRDIIGNRI
jgi:hypothetical protein